jgi:hypothetical protein
MRHGGPAVDLETWLECIESLTEAERDLLKLLRLLSAEAGQPDGGNAAVLAYYKIRRAIQALISRKLRAERTPPPNRRAKRRAPDDEVKSVRQRQRGTEGWHVLLVRTKAYELGICQRRRGREEATQLALQDFVDQQARRWKRADLRPIERRAVAILGGAPRNAKKSDLERSAIRLADAVIAEWFSPREKRGRPAGSKIKLAKTVADRPKLTSVAEVIETVWPTIEELAGPKASSSAKSTMVKAIVDAVQVLGDRKCTVDLAANVVRKLRRTSRPSTTSFHWVFGASDCIDLKF